MALSFKSAAEGLVVNRWFHDVSGRTLSSFPPGADLASPPLGQPSGWPTDSVARKYPLPWCFRRGYVSSRCVASAFALEDRSSFGRLTSLRYGCASKLEVSARGGRATRASHNLGWRWPCMHPLLSEERSDDNGGWNRNWKTRANRTQNVCVAMCVHRTRNSGWQRVLSQGLVKTEDSRRPRACFPCRCRLHTSPWTEINWVEAAMEKQLTRMLVLARAKAEAGNQVGVEAEPKKKNFQDPNPSSRSRRKPQRKSLAKRSKSEPAPQLVIHGKRVVSRECWDPKGEVGGTPSATQARQMGTAPASAPKTGKGSAGKPSKVPRPKKAEEHLARTTGRDWNRGADTKNIGLTSTGRKSASLRSSGRAETRSYRLPENLLGQIAVPKGPESLWTSSTAVDNMAKKDPRRGGVEDRMPVNKAADQVTKQYTNRSADKVGNGMRDGKDGVADSAREKMNGKNSGKVFRNELMPNDERMFSSFIANKKKIVVGGLERRPQEIRAAKKALKRLKRVSTLGNEDGAEAKEMKETPVPGKYAHTRAKGIVVKGTVLGDFIRKVEEEVQQMEAEGKEEEEEEEEENMGGDSGPDLVENMESVMLTSSSTVVSGSTEDGKAKGISTVDVQSECDRAKDLEAAIDCQEGPGSLLDVHVKKDADEIGAGAQTCLANVADKGNADGGGGMNDIDGRNGHEAAEAPTQKAGSIAKGRTNMRKSSVWRVFLLDVHPICYRGKKPSASAFLNWLSLFLRDVNPKKDPVIAVVKIVRAEADDVIATLAEQALGMGLHVVVASPDCDFRQLLGERVQICSPRDDLQRWSFYTEDHFKKQCGCTPAQHFDTKCLLGDKTDCVAGLRDIVPGFGAATARKLILKHGSLDALLSAAKARPIGREFIRSALLDNEDLLRTNQRALFLRRDVEGVLLKPEWCIERDISNDDKAFEAIRKEIAALPMREQQQRQGMGRTGQRKGQVTGVD
ncbi:hypothetical protein CBR_g56098 [Chara braunii]|uniref:5'-3' exonuclease domain-containing protein n=1 Tax=Chara braunii TaxID=69332 RepID=A0A388MDK8_CHABU|nr:hypothetical protein CBR_g56098 [Chara braunii]|eukprot:GBG92585.1 hypothetical protein CBR_g56098 [Chara braunii]